VQHPIRKRDIGGGYTDSDLGNGIHLITVRVNGYTDAATAYEYFHRRAGELCGEYDVIELRDSEKVGYGKVGESYVKIQKPRIFGRIKCRSSK